MDLSKIQQKITDKVYVNNSAEFIRDVELMVANCEQYNGKRSSKYFRFFCFKKKKKHISIELFSYGSIS